MPAPLTETVGDTFAQALDHHQGDRHAEAEALYRQVIEALPDCAPALNNLALLVPSEEALSLLHRAVAAEPEYVDALINLSGALHAQGDSRGTALFYDRALALIPDRAEELFRLGRILHSQGRADAAIAQYERAVTLDPALTGALCNLASLYAEAKQLGQAASYLSRALALDPAAEALIRNMVLILKQEGRLREAAAYAARLSRPQPLEVATAPAARRVVLLASDMIGTVPIETLLPKSSNTLIAWEPAYATDAQQQALPPHDVVFNIIGNADLIDDAHDRLAQMQQRRPMLNPPEAVARTRRDRMPDLLHGLPGVVVPPVLRLERAELQSPDLRARFNGAGLGFPLLVRPIVGHGGQSVLLAQSVDEFATLGCGNADAYYLIGYHESRSADGYYRKYRMIFVDRVPYAYHLAISERWLVHYFSADMMAAPWKRDEEAAFLADPAAVLSASTMAAVAAIARRVDLDYGGIDFSVLPDGQVLVFEANATMLVHLNDDPALFAYKTAPVRAILQAFGALLDRAAA